MTTPDRSTNSLVLGYLCFGAAVGVGLGALALQLHRLGFSAWQAASPTRVQIMVGLIALLVVGGLAAFADHEEIDRLPEAHR